MPTQLPDPQIPSPPRPTTSKPGRPVADRAPTYDGSFVYAVESTHVYCRPSCPSRRPLRENVRFYSAATDAERAGFRACKRCDPRDERGGTETERAIERARAYLDSHTDRAVP